MICNPQCRVCHCMHVSLAVEVWLFLFEVTWRCYFCSSPCTLFLRIERDNPLFLFSGCSNFKNIRDPSCSNFIFYWLESPGIICLHCILPKKDSWKKDRLNYETADVPPEVTAHGGNSSLSFQHQHLSGRSKSFLRLNIKWRQWCQGESNQWSIFGLQETRASRLLSKTDFQPVLWETFHYNEATVLKAI